MGPTTGAVTLLIFLAVLAVAAFIFLWVRDKERADDQAADHQRIEPDPAAEAGRGSFARTPPGHDEQK